MIRFTNPYHHSLAYQLRIFISPGPPILSNWSSTERSPGKSPSLTRQMPAEDQRPEQALLYILSPPGFSSKNVAFDLFMFLYGWWSVISQNSEWERERDSEFKQQTRWWIKEFLTFALQIVGWNKDSRWMNNQQVEFWHGFSLSCKISVQAWNTWV